MSTSLLDPARVTEAERNGVAARDNNLPQQDDLIASPSSRPDALTPEMRSEWEKWETVGRAAGQSARNDLHTHGLGFVYKDASGAIVEELPDGTLRTLYPSELKP